MNEYTFQQHQEHSKKCGSKNKVDGLHWALRLFILCTLSLDLSGTMIAREIYVFSRSGRMVMEHMRHIGFELPVGRVNMGEVLPFLIKSSVYFYLFRARHVK